MYLCRRCCTGVSTSCFATAQPFNDGKNVLVKERGRASEPTSKRKRARARARARERERERPSIIAGTCCFAQGVPIAIPFTSTSTTCSVKYAVYCSTSTSWCTVHYFIQSSDQPFKSNWRQMLNQQWWWLELMNDDESDSRSISVIESGWPTGYANRPRVKSVCMFCMYWCHKYCVENVLSCSAPSLL